jgi:hypothetical protein
MCRFMCVAVCLAMIVLLGGHAAPAAEDRAEPAAESAAATAEEIRALVEQFDSDKYAERQAASEKLGQIGLPAVPALIEAATGQSLEATVRSIELLTKLLESSDEAVRDAAKEALGKVAESDRPSAARRAQDALRAFEARQTAAAAAIRPNVGVIQLGVAGGGRRVSVRTVDGVKTIEGQEGDQKVKIVEDPKQGIQMEVTDKNDDGKETTEKFEAKDAEELKKKHPKAYEIYVKYSQMGGGGAIQVQFGGNVQAIQAVPLQRPNAVDTAARVLGSWGQTLDRLVSEEAIKQAPKESKEELKKKIGEMKEYLDKLEERLEKAVEAKDEPAKEEAAKEQ